MIRFGEPGFVFLLMNTLRIFAFYRYFSICFPKKQTLPFYELAAYLVCLITTDLVFLIYDEKISDRFSDHIAVLFGLTALSFLYSRKILRNIGVSLSVYTAWRLCESLPPEFSVSLLRNGSFIVSVLLFFVTALQCELFAHRLKRNQKRAAILLGADLAADFLLIGLCAYFETSCDTVILLLMLETGFYLFLSMYQKQSDQREQALTAQQARAYSNQLDILADSQEKIRFLRHDMKNHLQQMRLLLEQNRLSELQSYMQTSEAALTSAHEYSRTGNRDIDSLLNYKCAAAERLGAEITVDASVPDTLPVEPFDLAVILGNLADNAIAALRGAPEKILCISLRYDKNILFLSVQNSCAEPPEFAGGRPVRKQPDDPAHGIGLNSVGNALKKYHGSLKFSCEDALFTATAMLYL